MSFKYQFFIYYKYIKRVGHKRRRQHKEHTMNKLAHSQKRQFMKVQLCKKLRNEFDITCNYDGFCDGYDPKDKTKLKHNKQKSKYRRNDIDIKEFYLNITSI